MGPTISLGLREGDPLLVRAQVELPSERSCLVRITTDLKGSRRLITVPHSELFLADYSTNAAYEATRLAMQRLDQLRDVMVRVQAEFYELGLHTGDAKRGLILG
jgi:hypothetical protein